MRFKLNDNQEKMVTELLLRTTTKKDIELNAEKIMGNVYGNARTAKVFIKLANMRMAIKR